MDRNRILRALAQWALIITLLVGLLFSSLDASIVSTSLISISLELQDFMNSPWVILSYLLAYIGFAIAFAKLSDLYGRRELLCIAWILFAGFSIGCALAKTMVQLIIFRAFQGIGGSGLYSLAQIGLFEVGPVHRPSLLGALIGMTLAVSFVLGPVLGGSISYKLDWRWIFWINIPFGGVALAIILAAWPRGSGGALGYIRRHSVKKIDFLGNFLVLAASTLLIFALQEGGAFSYAWNSAAIVSALTIASLSWVLFVVWELHLGMKENPSIEPLIPMRLVTHRVYMASLISTLFTGFNYLAAIIIIPERFQIVNGEDSLYAGIHLLPLLGATAFGSFLAGAVSSKRNNTSITLIVSSSFQLIGVGLLSTLSASTEIVKAQYGYQVLLGLGIGLGLGAATILASVHTTKEELAVAHGAIAQARVFGGAVGIAICNIIVNARIQNELADKIDADDMQALHHSPTITQYIPPDQQELVRGVYAAAFTDDIKMLICVSAIGFIASLLTFERHPPPMPAATRRQTSKDVMGSSGHSETELGELVSPREDV